LTPASRGDRLDLIGGAAPQLDSLARDLATGAISRRTALRRFAGASLGAIFAGPAGLFGAKSALANCPQSRRCSGKCCPSHAHCHHGKCRCRKGFTRCGKSCRNVQTDVSNCGTCGHKCASGEICHNGHCKPGQAVCANGVVEGTEQCDGANLGGTSCIDLGFVSGTLACTPNCTFDTSGCVAAPTCVDGVKNGDETDVDCGGSCPKCAYNKTCLGNNDCVSGLCASGHCLSCGDGLKNGDETDVDCGGSCSPCANGKSCGVSADCASGVCSGGTCVPCASNQDCGGNSSTCSEHVCVRGACQTQVTDGDVCGATSQGCPIGLFRDKCCSNGICTQLCSPCQ